MINIDRESVYKAWEPVLKHLNKMTLKETIQKDRMLAMKARENEKKSALTTLIGELERLTEKDGKTPIKNPSDAQVIAVVKKFIANNIECGTESENVHVEGYLPQMMSESELGAAIQAATIKLGVDSMKGMSLVMKELQQSFPGQYDGKVASELVKSILS